MTEPTLFTAAPALEEDVTTTLYRAAIGPVNPGYYLPIFTRFEAADHAGISWNTAASLLTLNWLVFRKLWVAALAYVGILVAVALLVFGIGYLVLQFSDTLMMALGLGFGLVAFVLPGLFGNALYHTECRKAMSKALVGHANVADARTALLQQASTRRRAIWLAAANAACLLIGVLVYLQVAALSSVTVMPQGALEAGPVAVGRTVTASAPRTPSAAVASAPTLPITTISPDPAPAASASAPSASLPVVAASAAAAPASTPMATTSASSTNTPPVTGTSIGTSPASKAVAATKAIELPKVETAAAVAPAVEVKPLQAADKTTAKTKKLQTALTPPPKPAKTSASDATPAVAANRPFFINVGLFAVPENAERANAKLLEAQLPSVVKELKSTKGRQIRVRVGPFVSQAAADAAAEKIKALQLDASIIHP